MTIAPLDVGAVGDLLSLLSFRIKNKDFKVLAATVETCEQNGIKTLTITYE